MVAGEHGTVNSEVNGIYNYGDVVMFNATPDTGYVFAYWDNDPTNTANPMAQGVYDAINHTANFTLAEYTLTVGSNNYVMGTATIDEPQSVYHYGDSAMIHATCLDTNLYKFLSWSDGESSLARIIYIHEDVQLMAIFGDAAKLNVTVVSNNDAWGSVSASATSVTYGDSVTLIATAMANYHFEGWSDTDDTLNERTIAVVSDTMITAMFAIDVRTLTLDVEGNGTVTGAGEYEHGEQVVFYATAGEHSHFVRWNDSVTVNPRTVVMDGDKSFTAIFVSDSVTITANAVDGYVNAESTVVAYGDSVTLVATGAEHHGVFAGWTRNGMPYDGGDSIVFAATENATFVATFTYDIHTLALGVEGNGTVTGAGSYEYGSDVLIYATAGEHSHFMRWNDNETVNPRTVVVESDTTFTAIFAIDSISIAATAVNGFVNTESTVVAYGDNVTLVATGAEHYSHFIGWTRNGMPYDGGDSIVFAATENATFVATYAIDTVNLTADVNNHQWGYITGTAAGDYTYGTEVTLVAHNLDNSHFIGWFNANDSIMSDTLATVDTLSFTLTADSNVVAVFAPDTYVIDITSNDTLMGTVTGSGVYHYHDLVIVEATPNEGYLFIGWSDSVATASRYFYVESDTAVMAIFIHEPHMVTVEVNDTTMGSVTGAGLYNWGDTVTLEAIPNENFIFVGFNGMGNGVTTLSFVVTEDTTVTATFDHKPVRLYVQAENGSVDVTIDGNAANVDRQPMMAHYNDEVVLAAVADEHYQFVEWQSYTLAYDTTYDTILVIDSVWVVSSYFDDEGVEYTEYDTLWHQETVATVDTINILDSVYTDNPFNFNITYDRLFVAVFEPMMYSVNVSGLHGIFEGSNNYHYGDTVTISCTPDEHYRFVSWMGVFENDDIVTENPYTFIVERNMEIVGYCEAILYTLALEASPAEGGSVDGAGEYEYASDVVITATANEGYRFIAWSDGDTNAMRTVTVASDTMFTAIFENLGIEQTDMSNVTIYANGNVIVVDGAEGMTVRVFDALGRVAAVSEAKSESVRIAVNTTGIYLVQVGNAPARRVMVMR